MLSQKFNRIISSLLIVSMIVCSNGFSALANSVDGVVEENLIKSSEQSIPNYYLEQKEYREELLLKTFNGHQIQQ